MTTKKRMVEFDLMRIIACFCVIMIHTPVFEQSKLYDYNTLQFQATNIWGTLSRWAVPAFVMLSGMMVIPGADQVSIKTLFCKRVMRMIGAYIAWSAIYSAYNVFVLKKIYAVTPLKTFIDGCFSGEIHMWYLLMLAGMYLASPLLAIIVKTLDKKWSFYWLSMLAVFSSIIPFLVKLNIKFISVVVNSMTGYMDMQFYGGWTLYFVLGYYLLREELTEKQLKILAICAIAGFVFTLWGTVIVSYITGSSMGVLPYEYPNIYLFSIGVFLFFKEKVSSWSFLKKYETAIVYISKLTFGIYLSHVLILKVLYFIGINIQILPTIISIPLVAIIVFICGAILSALLQKVPMVGRFFA